MSKQVDREKKAEYQRRYYQKNKEIIKAWQKQYSIDNREKIYKVKQIYREKNKEKIAAKQREYHIQNKYGLLIEDYRVILEKQGGMCAICNSMNKNRRLVIDHCHETGRVRGLLCYWCNTTLGRFGDSLNSVLDLIKYLERFEEESSSG